MISLAIALFVGFLQFQILLFQGIDVGRVDEDRSGRQLLQQQMDKEYYRLFTQGCDPSHNNGGCGPSLSLSIQDSQSNDSVDQPPPEIRDCAAVIDFEMQEIKGRFCRISCEDCNAFISPQPTVTSIPSSTFGFNAPVVWLKEFGSEFDIIYVEDINGDQLSDIVAFGELGVYVALSTGTHFDTPSLWSTDFGSGPTAGQWKEFSINPRLLGDINGDGLSDVIGFNSDGTHIALNNGTSFKPTELWDGPAPGWIDHTLLPRKIMDVNGDGMEDILALGLSDVWVIISNGSSLSSKRWSNNFGSDEYAKDINPVIAADVNGDGLPDLIAFGNAHVDLSLNTGSKFTSKQPLFDAFSSKAGWRVDRHPRFVQDIDNDGLADIVGMGDGGVFVSLSQGENFEQPKLVIPDFGFYAGSWDVTKHIRMLDDVNGDGLLDVVGFKNKGVYISFGLGLGAFDQPFMAIDWFGYDMSAGGWDSTHPRYVSDVNGDGKGDIIGFTLEGVYVSTATIE